MNWEDGRLFLAVARAGQMLSAARALGINQATLGRRMTAFETSLGTKLLHRRTNGCELTAQGVTFFEYLERIETEFIGAATEVQHTDTSVSGIVRIGAPDGFGVSFLAPRLGLLARQHPELSIQLVPVPRSFSLSKREADIAVMIGRPKHGRLVARKLTDYTLGLYATPAYLTENGTPENTTALAAHRLIGYVDDLVYAPSLNYTDEFARAWKSQIEVSSAIGQMEAVRSGAGIGILHDYLAADVSNLVPILPQTKARRSYWTVFHESLRDVARVRVVSEFLDQQIKQASTDFVMEMQ